MKTMLISIALLLALSGNLYAQRGYDDYRRSYDPYMQYELDRMNDRPIKTQPRESALRRMLREDDRRMEMIENMQIYERVYGNRLNRY